mmetsp:Transcript_24758/g.58126  ORF Transcript_24758/g.58126 Transcript_24758/m.58126 type:complete len:319 (+) Transcript_24758:242-1198(+)
MATMTMAAITVLLALWLPSPNYAFTLTQSRLPSTGRLVSRAGFGTASRNSALSARDTIFSLNDDDDETSEEIDVIDSNEIEDIVNSMMDDVNEVGGDVGNTSDDKKKIGDPLREDNGVRPSIHPAAINAIAEALKARAFQSVKATKEVSDSDEMMHFRVTDTVEPLMVMVTAGQFASDAIQKRQESSEEDGMLLTQGEEQTLAGRIMGVIMRFDDLEAELAERTAEAGWVGQYNEWGNFGVVEGEHETTGEGDDAFGKVQEKILDDPLFCLNRAECLLAIFLQEVEIPQLKKVNETVPDGSQIDFLDQDRREVVLQSE